MKRGDTLAFLAEALEQAAVGERECIVWPFGRGAKGYPRLKVDGVDGYAHRAACLHAHGPQPVGMEAAHSCRNPPCVNANHLSWKTSKENDSDKTSHGTMYSGESHHSARLTEAAVRVIRSSPATDTQLAARFGVSKRTVNAARNHVTWKHVE